MDRYRIFWQDAIGSAYLTALTPTIEDVEWINAEGKVITNARYHREISVRVKTKEAHQCFVFLVVQSANWGSQNYVEMKEIEQGENDIDKDTIFSFTPSMDWRNPGSRGDFSSLTAKVYLVRGNTSWGTPRTNLQSMARDFESINSEQGFPQVRPTFNVRVYAKKEAERLTINAVGTLKIWYRLTPQGARERRWTNIPIIYRDGDILPPNTFAEQVVRAINFNIENGKRVGNDGGRPSRDALNRNITIEIWEVYWRSVYSPYARRVEWNPNAGVETHLGVRRSPASVLDHELDHAVQHFTNPEQYAIDRVRDGTLFTSREEYRVITGSERRTAVANGEIRQGQKTRTQHHGGRSIATKNEISNEEHPDPERRRVVEQGTRVMF